MLRDEPLAGTASTIRAFLLIEDTGPWGTDALRDARLPDGLGDRIRAQAARGAGPAAADPAARPLGRRRAPAVFAAYADPDRPLAGARHARPTCTTCSTWTWSGSRAGRSSGLERDESSIFCVCTHGKHDTCCAERGRPVAAALEAAHPDHTWEVSHIGGDRFAGNMLVLPHGLYYGRIDAVAALAVAGAHAAGELDLDHLRGRSGLPTACAVRRGRPAPRARRDPQRLGPLRLDGSVDGRRPRRCSTSPASRYAVRVTTRHDPAERLTCSALRDNPAPSPVRRPSRSAGP